MIHPLVWRVSHHAACMVVVLLVVACKGEDFPSRAVAWTDGNSPSFSTRDMTPVELYLQEKRGERVSPFYGETLLKIPKAFLEGQPNWSGHIAPLGRVNLVVALPNMQPASVFGEDLFVQMKETHRQMLVDNMAEFGGVYGLKLMQDTVLIRISYGHCFGVTQGIPEWLEKYATKDRSNTDPIFEKYDGGFEHQLHHYVPKAPAKWKTYIECTDNAQRCSARTDYDALVSFEYLFSISRLHEYKEIGDKIRKLIELFITKNQPAADMPVACVAEVIQK